jgi:predicted lipid-binding transport protein (Tim44 family)
LRRRELLRFFAPAMGATAVGLLAGLYLMLGAEFRWASSQLLDDLALPVIAAASWWMFYNRMGSKRNRRESR